MLRSPNLDLNANHNAASAFTEIKTETIIAAFARQLQEIANQRDWSGAGGSLLMAFVQYQSSDNYNGAGRLLRLWPQTIILIGRAGHLNADQPYYVQGIFKESGKADRLTDVAKLPDLDPETAVREVMQQRSMPSLTKMKVQPADLSGLSLPVSVQKLETIEPASINPLTIIRLSRALHPRVTLG